MGKCQRPLFLPIAGGGTEKRLALPPEMRLMRRKKFDMPFARATATIAIDVLGNCQGAGFFVVKMAPVVAWLPAEGGIARSATKSRALTHSRQTFTVAFR